jgi:hypothetical protein
MRSRAVLLLVQTYYSVFRDQLRGEPFEVMRVWGLECILASIFFRIFLGLDFTLCFPVLSQALRFEGEGLSCAMSGSNLAGQ